MALKFVLDSLDGLDESLHSLYEQNKDDQKFYLSVDDLDASPVVQKFKNNEQAARRAERALKTQVEKWEKLGKTDAEIQELIAKATQQELDDAEKKGEWEKLKSQMNERHNADLKKKDDAIEAEKGNTSKLRGQIMRYLVDAKATAAIAAAEGEPDLLLDLVKRHIKVEEDQDGEFRTSIVDEKGGARVNGKGDPLTIDELLSEMRSSEKLGRAFKASGQSGSGAQPGGGSNPKGPPAGVPKSWSDAKTPEDKAKYLNYQKTLVAAK